MCIFIESPRSDKRAKKWQSNLSLKTVKYFCGFFAINVRNMLMKTHNNKKKQAFRLWKFALIVRKKTHICTMFPSIPTAVGLEWRNICRRQQSISGPCENWPGRLNLKVITIRDRMTGCIFVWFELYSISASQFIRVWVGWFTTKCHVTHQMNSIGDSVNEWYILHISVYIESVSLTLWPSLSETF